MEALTEIERYRFCDVGFFNLLTPLMIADSKSYTLLNVRVTEEARNEFLTTHSFLINQWQAIRDKVRATRFQNGYL